MANTKQALKRSKQAEKHRINNKWQISRMNTAIKKVIAAITAKESEVATKAHEAMSSVLDKLATKGLIHKNKAARYKSRLIKQIGAL